ncbi:MAG: response regulator [Planctomycetota bacterium]|nr:response regulator [Planctomycetota bacterium]
MTDTVRLLYFEDDALDAELVLRMLKREGLTVNPTLVTYPNDFEKALDTQPFDLILCDNNLPGYDGASALRLAKQKKPEIPFIFVSGTLGEENAIEALKRGATDYVLKDRLGRLALAVRRALRETEELRQRKAVEAALKEKEEELRQVQKLEAIGQLAGGIAHDFNNLLTIINGHSYMAMTKLNPGEKLRSKLELIYKTGNRAAALTKQLLAFSRKQVLQPRVLSINQTIEEIAKLIQRLIGEDIELKLALHPQAGNVSADPTQLDQVFMNLSVNARDAMPRGGSLTFESCAHSVQAGEESDLPPGNYVRVTVRDTGHGIEPAVLLRIWEPFFTTKPVGKGTGLGLSTVFGIVKQSGGHIACTSEVGKGTAFHIFLPRVEDPTNQDAKESGLAAVAVRQETILLAEDEDGIRDLIAETLRVSGYKVLEAPNGRKAMELADAHPEAIHLLVTDLIMPEMGGKDLVAALRKKHSGLRVLYMTGYNLMNVSMEQDEGGACGFIEKPFSPSSLTRAIRQILDA